MNERRFSGNSRHQGAFIDIAGDIFVWTLEGVKAMAMILGESIRGFLVRSLAVVTVVLTYAFGNIGAQVLSVAGISALGVTVAATPANAWRRYRRGPGGRSDGIRAFVYSPDRVDAARKHRVALKPG